jgi:hypothetical protein
MWDKAVAPLLKTNASSWGLCCAIKASRTADQSLGCGTLCADTSAYKQSWSCLRIPRFSCFGDSETPRSTTLRTLATSHSAPNTSESYAHGARPANRTSSSPHLTCRRRNPRPKRVPFPEPGALRSSRQHHRDRRRICIYRPQWRPTTTTTPRTQGLQLINCTLHYRALNHSTKTRPSHPSKITRTRRTHPPHTRRAQLGAMAIPHTTAHHLRKTHTAKAINTTLTTTPSQTTTRSLCDTNRRWMGTKWTTEAHRNIMQIPSNIHCQGRRRGRRRRRRRAGLADE